MMDKRALLIMLLCIVCVSTGRSSIAPHLTSFEPASVPVATDLLTRIKSDIKTAYEDLENPKYRFMRNAAPPSKVIGELKANGFVVNDSECTHREVDVCFSYCLTKSGSKWKLMISMVGPYAVLFRDLGTRRNEFVPPIKRNMTVPEQSVFSALTKSEITLIDFPTLSSRVSLKCQNTPRESVLVYQALFRDLPVLPWLSR